MTTVIRHVCPIPGCQGGANGEAWYHDQPMPVMTPGMTLPDIHRLAAEAAQSTSQATREHMATHFLPNEGTTGDPTDRPTIGDLHDGNGQATVRLAPHVESLIVVTSEGGVQIVGRDTTTPAWLGAALINSGLALLTGDHPPKVPWDTGSGSAPDLSPEEKATVDRFEQAPDAVWPEKCPVLDDEGIAPCGKALEDGDCPRHGRVVEG